MNDGSHVSDLNCCLCCWNGVACWRMDTLKDVRFWSQLLVNFGLIEQEAPVGSRN